MKYDEDIEHIYLDDDTPARGRLVHVGSSLAEEASSQYKRLGLLLLGVLVTSSALTIIRGIELNRFLADFMAVFLITFASFKIVNIESFVIAYRKYDIVASKIRPWAYITPFLEVLMGFWYLLSEGPMKLNLLAVSLACIALTGSFLEAKHRSRFEHSYFGSLIKLPHARVRMLESFMTMCLALALILV